jgi:hypothetical protein
VKREVIHVEGDDRTTLYEPQIPEVTAELLTSIPGYSGLFRGVSGFQSERSEGSSWSNLGIREANNTITISFRGNGNTDTKSFFPEQDTPPQALQEKKVLEGAPPDFRTQDESKGTLSPDNGTELLEASYGPESAPECGGIRPEPTGIAQAELMLIIRKTMVELPAPWDGKRQNREYFVAIVAAQIRRRYPQLAGRNIEYEINRLNESDSEIQSILAELTEVV